MTTKITDDKISVPVDKWYIIYEISTKEIRVDLQLCENEDIGGRIISSNMCVIFDTEEEGLLYIEENNLLTEESVINSIMNGNGDE